MAIWQLNKRVLGLFFTAHAQKRLLRNIRSKIWPRHSFRRPRFSYKTEVFPLPRDVYGIYSMFFATTSHDLVTLIFDLLTLSVFLVHCFSYLTNIPISIVLYDRCISTSEWRLLDIFDVFCYYVAWSCDLDLWPFDLEIVSCTALLMSDPHTNFYYPTTIGYWVTSTEYSITFPLSETVTAHAPCHVTSNQRLK